VGRRLARQDHDTTTIPFQYIYLLGHRAVPQAHFLPLIKDDGVNPCFETKIEQSCQRYFRVADYRPLGIVETKHRG
jgi:hypothetical protein